MLNAAGNKVEASNTISVKDWYFIEPQIFVVVKMNSQVQFHQKHDNVIQKPISKSENCLIVIKDMVSVYQGAVVYFYKIRIRLQNVQPVFLLEKSYSGQNNCSDEWMQGSVEYVIPLWKYIKIIETSF